MKGTGPMIIIVQNLSYLSCFCCRKNAPPLSFVTSCKIFFLSLFGYNFNFPIYTICCEKSYNDYAFINLWLLLNFRITFSLNIYGVALIYTSASLAAATTNCIPIITFFIALLFGWGLDFLSIWFFISNYYRSAYSNYADISFSIDGATHIICLVLVKLVMSVERIS